MRIISGKWKGRPIKVPMGLPIRPTTDFAKEALFNILENQFNWDQTKAMDLFAGSGNISFELISRGCSEVRTVERDILCCKFINSMIFDLKLDTLKLVRSDVFRYLELLKETFDLIFADPPYNQANLGGVAQKVLSLDLLKEGGLFVLEHPALIAMNGYVGFLETRIYGTSAFSFFSPKTNPS